MAGSTGAAAVGVKNHIRLYNVNGWWWLGFVVGKRLHLVTRLGRVGDCIRP